MSEKLGKETEKVGDNYHSSQAIVVNTKSATSAEPVAANHDDSLKRSSQQSFTEKVSIDHLSIFLEQMSWLNAYLKSNING